MENVSLREKSVIGKMMPDCQYSLDQDVVHHEERRSRSIANKSNKAYHKKFTHNKEIKTLFKQNRKLSENIKNDFKKITDQERDVDKQTQLEVWYYLLYHLEESEKLIALKLLVGINKMKKDWKNSFKQNKYVDKKVVEDMKLIIKNLQDEQKKNETEKQKLIQEKNKLEQKIIEERKYRLYLTEMLANKIGNSKEKVLNRTEVLNITEAELQNQTFTEIVSKQKPSTSKILLDDSNNNTQVSKIKGDTQKGRDFRVVLDDRENARNKEHHMNFVQPPIRNFSSFTRHSRNRKSPGNINDRLCVNIRTSVKRIPELISIMEETLRSPISINKVVPINEGWKIEFPSFREKIDFFNQRRMFLRTKLYITNPYRLQN